MTEHAPVRILLVEDEPAIGAAACLALEELGGYTVELCDSGTKTVDATRRFRPDLILLDALMPGMDGPSTLAALRNDGDFAELPVVFMTGLTDPAELDRFRSLGAIDVIAKPFDPISLPDRVRQIMGAPHE
jgi:two-component system, OmpR family, response regulator